MKFFFFLLAAGLTYAGYLYFTHSPLPQFEALPSSIGANISHMATSSKEYLSNITNGKSEPIINQLVTKTTDTLKDLPAKEAEKIKYEFCRGVVNEYENK